MLRNMRFLLNAQQSGAFMKNTTRDRLVEAARTLFWKHGYAGTGIAQILKEADAGSGSLYYFFPYEGGLASGCLGLVSRKPAACGRKPGL